jgi:hypothetical protein
MTSFIPPQERLLTARAANDCLFVTALKALPLGKEE